MPHRLSADFIAHIARLKAILDEVNPKSMEAWVEGFVLDVNPARELFIWECIANTYQAVVQQHVMSPEARQEAFKIAFCHSFGEEDGAMEVAKCKHLDAETAAAVGQHYRAAATALAALGRVPATKGTASDESD